MIFFAKPVSRAKSPCLSKDNEAGYLLIGASICLLVIAGLLSSYSFTTSRDLRQNSFEAVGKQLAVLSYAAHIEAQRQVYDLGNPLSTTPILLPAYTAFFDQFGTNQVRFTVRVIGLDAAPINATLNQAASALVVLRMNMPTGETIRDTDLTAIKEGAAKLGLTDIGVNGDYATFCGGEDAAVVWDMDRPNITPDTLDDTCLSATDATTLNLQVGDLVVPTWRYAWKKFDQRIALRFPLPDQPPVVTFNTNLNLNANDLTLRNGRIEATDLNLSQTLDANSATFQNTLTSATTESTGTITVSELKSETNGALTLNGDITFNGDISMNNGTFVTNSLLTNTCDVSTGTCP